MKMRSFIFAAFLLLVGFAASAQTETYTVAYSGWGRVEVRAKSNGTTSYDYKVSELDIPRWRKANGTMEVDGKQVTIRLARKEITYALLTDSYVHPAKDGWSYVEHVALENEHTICRVWFCTHEDGSRQFLVLNGAFVNGYKIIPVES